MIKYRLKRLLKRSLEFLAAFAFFVAGAVAITVAYYIRSQSYFGYLFLIAFGYAWYIWMALYATGDP